MPIRIARPNLYALPNGRGRPLGKGPMGEMNVTPFIDVLLVLIIMLIMVVPIATQKTEVDLPGKPPTQLIELTENTVFIDAQDQLFWNGAKVTSDQLSDQVYHAAQIPEEPLLRFEPAASASYDASAKTIALIKDAGAEKFAFIGNHRHRDFDR